MQPVRTIFKERALLLAFLALLLIVFGIWISNTDKGQGFRQLTGYHSPVLDFFFRYITHLGDGVFIITTGILIGIRKQYILSGGILISYMLSGIFAQAGKRLLDLPRPKAWFEAIGETVYQVPGIEVHMKGSFPSGHTTSAFALAVVLILMLPCRWYSWLLLLLAIIVGYSRIYLSQHFPVDVWAGAMIGAFSGIIVFLIIKNSKYLSAKEANPK
jgi:membrane-associated phospholipid phosphatase